MASQFIWEIFISFQPNLTDQEVGSVPAGMDGLSCERGKLIQGSCPYGGIQQKGAISAYRAGLPHKNRAIAELKKS